ncbi:hypothetical protein EJ07DRAFT_178122 [Lizonia empirigonia]|nr:hypothetical protein EJ07DRAFT_178122 [Lizonia empirigonia]
MSAQYEGNMFLNRFHYSGAGNLPIWRRLHSTWDHVNRAISGGIFRPGAELPENHYTLRLLTGPKLPCLRDSFFAWDLDLEYLKELPEFYHWTTPIYGIVHKWYDVILLEGGVPLTHLFLRGPVFFEKQTTELEQGGALRNAEVDAHYKTLGINMEDAEAASPTGRIGEAYWGDVYRLHEYAEDPDITFERLIDHRTPRSVPRLPHRSDSAATLRAAPNRIHNDRISRRLNDDESVSPRSTPREPLRRTKTDHAYTDRISRSLNDLESASPRSTPRESLRRTKTNRAYTDRSTIPRDHRASDTLPRRFQNSREDHPPRARDRFHTPRYDDDAYRRGSDIVSVCCSDDELCSCPVDPETRRLLAGLRTELWILEDLVAKYKARYEVFRAEIERMDELNGEGAVGGGRGRGREVLRDM